MSDNLKSSLCSCVHYTCDYCKINNEPLRQEYIRHRDIQKKRIFNKNRGFGICKCIYMFDYTISECDRCSRDFAIWDNHFRSVFFN